MPDAESSLHALRRHLFGLAIRPGGTHSLSLTDGWLLSLRVGDVPAAAKPAGLRSFSVVWPTASHAQLV